MNLNDFKLHYEVHSTERRFSCPYCSYRFETEEHLNHHLKKVHNYVPNVTKEATNICFDKSYEFEIMEESEDY